MADTLPDINLPPGVFVDLNAASGLSVGTTLLIQNKGLGDAVIVELASGTPDNSNGGNPITGRKGSNPWQEVTSPAGTIWARSAFGTIVNVQGG